VRIDAADNVFFDLSNANFKIQQPTQPALTIGLSADGTSICLPNSFTTEVLTAGSLGFNSPVTLEITGNLPPGAVATLSKTALNVGESSTLEVDLNGVTQDGIFTFNIQASAVGSPPIVRPITLRLISNDFTALALESPADGLTDQALTQVLRWNAVPDADTYDVQFSSSPSFSSILASKTATPADSFKISFLLEKGKAYYWRVRPRNECGIHAWTEPFFFATFPENCSSFASNDLPKNITASSTPNIESKINVLNGGAISAMNVRQIKGYHEFFGDLTARLISPQGTEVVLFSGNCGNYNGFFNFGLDDAAPNNFPCPPANNGLIYKPVNPLSPFYGENSTGIWTLRVKDNVVTGGGTLEIFKLEFCASVAVKPPFLVNNNPLIVQPGLNEVITPSLLLAEDEDNNHDQLTFTLVTVPEHGLLEKASFGIMKAGDQFTQTDLDYGRIRFFDYGTNSGSDGFRFTVSDGVGGFLGTPKFIIQPLATGTNEPSNSLQFNIFPNPADDAVWLTLGQPADSEMRVSIFNSAGQVAQTFVLPAGADRFEMKLKDLPRGIYAVRLESEGGAGVRKLVLR
jgi:subtilisin-like proprotein convertase family protein